MIKLNCFKNTSLEQEFEKKAKDAISEEEEQEIGINLVLNTYEQLRTELDKLRKLSGLPNSKKEVIKDLSEIKRTYNDLIEQFQIKIVEYKNPASPLPVLKEEVKEEKIETTPTESNPVDSSTLIRISVGEKQYQVETATTDDEKEKGLSNRTSLASDSGMIFIWDEPDTIGMWMKDTKIPLDIIFIDDDLNVVAVYNGIPNSNEILQEDNISYVLEVNQNSGVKVGDELEFEPADKQVKSEKMWVLNSDGGVQMELEGGERIFSRPHTKTLIKFAKKAATTGNDNDYKALGKRVFKFLKVQSETEPEYVKSK